MRLILSLVFPWIVFFIAAVSGMVVMGVKEPPLPVPVHTVHMVMLGLGSALCLFMNLRSLGRIGIWMSESLPDVLRYGYGSARWVLRALKAVALAAAFWFASQLPWVPLIWHAAVLPAVVSISLFVFVWSLLGPILKWSSGMAWSRVFSVILSLPVLSAVPLTAYVMGKTMVRAYRASSGLLPVAVETTSSSDVDASTTDAIAKGAKAGKSTEVAVTLDAKDIRSQIRSPKPEMKATALKAVVQSGKPCVEYNKEIQIALDAQGPREVVLQAARAVGCADIRSVIALPKLVKIMLEHTDPATRAAAIFAMKKYGEESLRQVSYLVVKRISVDEPPEVIEAAASALAPLGADHAHWGTNRLKVLLEADEARAVVAARSLIRDYGRDDLVASFVAANIQAEGTARAKAIGMICSLPAAKRAVVEPHIANVVAAIQQGTTDELAVRALACMGRSAFETVQAELRQPHFLKRPVAARILSDMNIREWPQAIDLVKDCARDEDENTRKWCSQSLGRIGAPALPEILSMLKSSDASLNAAGRTALQHFDDPGAKQELRKIVAANSGWMANNRNLQLAQALGTALAKIENEANREEPPPGDSSQKPATTR